MKTVKRGMYTHKSYSLRAMTVSDWCRLTHTLWESEGNPLQTQRIIWSFGVFVYAALHKLLNKKVESFIIETPLPPFTNMV